MIILSSIGIYKAFQKKNKASLSLNIITVLFAGGILYLIFIDFMSAIN